jgi:glycosyltransferase involved in cell wall biosynthesis
VGSGPESAKLGIEIRRLGLDSLVELHPQVSDAELHRFYSTSNVLVLPSLGAPESFGIVLLEGRAHGLRLVATDIPGVRELARHLGGVIVPPGDSRALASGIWAAVASPVPLEGGTSYTDLEREFSWDTVADRYLALYRRIATAATRGASDKSLGTSVSLAPSSLDAPPALGAGRR